MIRRVAEQSAANIAVQGLGAITTLSFVHLLSIHDYALFGLCVLTATFIAIVSDLGLLASMGYFWREALRGGTPFARQYHVIRRIRQILFAVSGTAGLAVLAYLLDKQGQDRSTLIIALVMAGMLAWAQIATAMVMLVLRLGERLRAANVAELSGSLIRALLAALAFVMAWRGFWFPIAAMILTSGITAALARRASAPIEKVSPATMADARPVLLYVLRTMPGSLLFATQELVIYGLASLRGGTVVVAQSFALGRLSAIFVVLGSVFANVVIPHVVNLADNRHAVRNGLLSAGLIALVCAGVIGVAALFPNMVLLVLGARYAGLQVELLLSLTMVSLQLVAQTLAQFNRSMGWVRLELPAYTVHAIMLLILVQFFAFDTVRTTLTFGCILAVLSVAESAFITLAGMRTNKIAEARVDEARAEPREWSEQ